MSTRTAAIIGGGVIGGGWAARFLLNGWNVRLFDPDPEAERKMGEVLANARFALPMLYDRALPPEGRLDFVGTVAEAVEGADWVQESVPERLDLKHRVYEGILDVVSDGVPVGSSTSGFKPSELRKGHQRDGQILVTHPFNPVYLLPLIEVVPGEGAAPGVADRAMDILRSIGLFPLCVRKEIDAHIADRFLEAVWREALWLIRDGIATTEEIDEAIRMGFGLRWAQMGLFETYRIAGGEAGMAHFIDQFGPALQWPWTKLMDVPELTPELVKQIAEQSDAQSAHLSIRELERLRDENLVSILRALKARNTAAGAVIRDHEGPVAPAEPEAVPMVTLRRTIPIDWTDYNGHMNESRYGQLWSDAADAVLLHVGVDSVYVGGGLSYFTLETKTNFLAEALAGETVEVHTRVTQGEGKKLRLFHQMMRGGEVCATCDQFLVHVSLTTRKSCDPAPEIADRVAALALAHKEAS